MIVLVWSLVSSVVEAARRRRLATFLRHFYDDPGNRKNMLVCKRNRQMDSFLSPSSSSARLTRFTSEPHLHTQQLIYRTERAELAVEQATALHPSEWRFVDIQNPQAGQKVYFVASIGRLDDEQPPQAVFLDSCCNRIAWNKLQPASLYACDLEQFVDIVYAFSEGALFENNFSALVESIHTIFPDTSQTQDLSLLPNVSPARSCHSSSSVLALTQQTPMPLLQQLFWGDKEGIQKRVTMRYGSETALHNGGHYGSLPRRTTTGSPSRRRRYRSCTSSSRSSKDLFQELGYEYGGASRFFDTSYQLPPFLRNLEKERTYSLSNGNNMDHKNILEQSSCRSVASSGISPSVTIEGIDLGHMEEDLAEIRSITADLPYVDDSTVTSPLAITDSTSSYAALVYRELAKRTAEGVERGDGVTSEQEETSHEIQVKINGQHANGTLINGSAVREKVNGSLKSLEEEDRRILNKPPPSNGSVRRNKRAESSGPPSASISRRRHSTMVQSLADTTFNFTENGRHRSVSPMPGDTLNGRRRSLRNSIFADSGSIEFPRPYTPSRRFYCHRTSVTEKTMSKPPSILVYTGDQKDLYSRIRRGLSRVLPSDRYTVFNISAEAVRKQPWIEKTTACLLIACTDGLDDMSWNKMQTYFNQAGKIIFVCQNRLLSSLTNCESSKKQADILRMALGHNSSGGMGKDFEHFLKKSLKTLNKQGVVNETFRSKDLAGGVSYSVVLAKTKETPLLLYMENSAHQAAAMFSDATPDQLLAPGSKILRDSLSRVGVLVHEHEVAEPTQGLLLAQESSLLDEIQGMRFGENIGKSPQLFLRKEGTVVEQGLPSPSRELLPIQVGQRDPTSYKDFNFSHYFRKLTTNRLGRVCLHVPVTTTTMDVMSSLCDAVPCLNGAIVIAGQQIHGQGRGGNEFISPLGAAMFTVSVEIPKSSQLAKRPSFIQHIFAVAIVDAIHSLSGMDDFPLRIKWPNDFYYNRSHKMGGLLATANFRDNSIAFTLGAGLNVTNSQPTVCLNDIAPEGQDIKFTIEEVIAETMNKFEIWLNRYELKGANEFLNKYYEYWLHDREEVLLEESGDKVIIRGLDEHGYLQVRSKRNPGKLISVMDNGNTFDMMKGLIRQKL